MTDASTAAPERAASDSRFGFGPVTASERIEILDILRGFALIGVLYVNMHNFGSWLAQGSAHRVAQAFMDVAFTGKFFSLFSLLFGIGFAIQMSRAETRKVSFRHIYGRRLVVLFLIGCAHWLIYPGDILRLYAALGFLLFALGKLSPRHLVMLAMLLFLVTPTRLWLVESGVVEFRPSDPELLAGEIRSATDRSQAEGDMRQRVVAAYTGGTIADVVRANLTDRERQEVVWSYGPPALALFLVGIVAWRRAVLSDVMGNRLLINRLAWWGVAIGGIAMVIVYVGWDGLPTPRSPAWAVPIRAYLLALGTPALMLSYAGAITLLTQRPRGYRFLHPLAAVGRMALTVYVGQSVIYTTIYYGYGLGYWGKLGPAHIVAIAAAIFTMEVVACNWWMRRFRFGPLEWFWRSLTYLKLQPMRVRSRA